MGELYKIRINVAKSTVEKYRPHIRKPPSPTWKAFLNNHVKDLVSCDFFTMPTATFRVLCLNDVIILDERHLPRILQSYVDYYHNWRVHRALDLDVPEPRPVQMPELGLVRKLPEVGGLHHHYERIAA